jgi:inorganic pyrophosphatase
MTRKTAGRAKRETVSKPITISVTIETPRGSRNKLKYEPAKKMFSLSKIMPEGMVFPYDFGFVPGTKAEDGDPLDVLVLTDEPLFPGCLVECTLVGVIELSQEDSGKKERNDRLVAVAQASLLYADVKDLAGLNGVVLKQVEEFFVNYQKVRNIKVTILGRHGPDRAREILRRSHAKKARCKPVNGLQNSNAFTA